MTFDPVLPRRAAPQQGLRRADRARADLAAPRLPRYGQVRDRLSPPRERRCGATGAERLYTHQAEAINAGAGGPERRRRHLDRQRQDAVLQRAGARSAGARSAGPRALPLPDQGAGAGSARQVAGAGQGGGRRASSTRWPPPTTATRRRAPASRIRQQRARPADQPRHAPRRHPAEPSALGRVLPPPALRGRSTRRTPTGACSGRRWRACCGGCGGCARSTRAAGRHGPADARLGDPQRRDGRPAQRGAADALPQLRSGRQRRRRRRPQFHRHLGHHRQPGRALRAADRAAGDRGQRRRLAARAADVCAVEPAVRRQAQDGPAQRQPRGDATCSRSWWRRGVRTIAFARARVVAELLLRYSRAAAEQDPARAGRARLRPTGRATWRRSAGASSASCSAAG